MLHQKCVLKTIGAYLSIEEIVTQVLCGPDKSLKHTLFGPLDGTTNEIAPYLDTQTRPLKEASL